MSQKSFMQKIYLVVKKDDDQEEHDNNYSKIDKRGQLCE